MKKTTLNIFILAFILPIVALADATDSGKVANKSIITQADVINSAPTVVQAPVIIERNARFHPVTSDQGMVVSQERIASRVGADILSRGGNAVDAAVAIGFVLAVTLPQAGNLGGGGFMLLYLSQIEKTVAIDYREMAPATAYKDLFLDNNGTVDSQKARFSRLSAGVPGTVAGLIHVLEHYGTMQLDEVIAPAIELAEEGFIVSSALAYSLHQARSRLKSNRASTRYFFKENGEPLVPGDTWRQLDLAKTLKKIASEGKSGFYDGSLANLIVAEMKRGNGIITRDDLANYHVVEREPIVGTYRDYTIASMPPPSSGGIHLIQMLNILEGWKLKSLGHNSAAYSHRLIETMRRAYADRSQYLGDPDFFPVPAQALVDKSYAAKLRAGISLEKATLSSELKPGLPAPLESPQTTHFSVWDSAGNVVSNTYTLNFSYGSGIAVEGAGFLLNNEMDDFSAKPGVPNAYGLVGDEANAIAPRKRPLSSMAPTIVFKQSHHATVDSDAKQTISVTNIPIMTLGSPGGSTIITVVLQNILNYIEFDMNIAAAAAAPRLHHQWLPDEVFVESGISSDTLTILEGMGHKIQKNRRVMGRVQVISRESDGQLSGVSDTRWPGGEATPECDGANSKVNCHW